MVHLLQAIQDKEQHSISFTLSRSQAIIVEYQHDDETDMFQVCANFVFGPSLKTDLVLFLPK